MLILKKLLNILVILLWLANFGCGTTEEKKEDPKEGRHKEYSENENFYIGKDFNYKSSNKVGYEIPVRSEKELDEHEPKVIILDKGKKIEITFPHHPQSPKHYWAWVEVVDQAGTELYKEFEEPKEDVKDFKVELTSETPLKLRVRVRAFCFVHGEFITYLDVPDFRVKTIIDK